jgi:8-oxo-dGTP diphosphatase
MTLRPVVPVVCAVIENDAGCVLVAQRPSHKYLGLKWEFAGGKVESGESAEAALIREIKEELACDIRIIRPLPIFQHDYGDVVIDMFPFVCALLPSGPELYAREHVGTRWVTLAELRAMDLAPADWPVVDAYETIRRSP